LHGEQYLELHSPIPEAATLVTRGEVIDIQDKGKGAVVVLRATTVDSLKGHVIAVNEFTTFVLDSGRFEGAKDPKPRAPAAVAANEPPTREPDVVVEEQTTSDQAALYR
jgi:hypothetical protein